jgi:hypothetical protein
MMPYLSGTSVLDRHRERRQKELKAITALAPKISFPGRCIFQGSLRRQFHLKIVKMSLWRHLLR